MTAADIDFLALEEGDVILRKGGNIVSGLIATAFPKGRGMSHCGVIVNDHGVWSVIHTISGSISDSDGIRISSLDEFIAKAEEGRVAHLKPSFPIERSKLSERAFYYLAQDSSFDHAFDLNDSSRLYCSELVRCVYLDCGAPDRFIYKQVGAAKLIDMASFFDPCMFYQVKGEE